MAIAARVSRIARILSPRRHNPGGRPQLYALRTVMGRQGFADRLDGCITMLRVFAKEGTKGPDLQRHRQNRLEITAADLHVCWRQEHVGEPGIGKDITHPVGIGKSERSRRTGRRRC